MRMTADFNRVEFVDKFLAVRDDTSSCTFLWFAYITHTVTL